MNAIIQARNRSFAAGPWALVYSLPLPSIAVSRSFKMELLFKTLASTYHPLARIVNCKCFDRNHSDKSFDSDCTSSL